jgi:integrase
MGYSKNEISGLWDVCYSKRHPITKVPYSLRRKGVKTEAEARRVEKALVLQLEEKLKAVVTPQWQELVDSYLSECDRQGFSKKTLSGMSDVLKASTKCWNLRFIDSISTEDIRKVVKEDYAHRSLSHQKNVLKFIRGSFNHAFEKGLLGRNPTPQLKFRIGDKIKKVLTKKQARHLLEQAKIHRWFWYPHYVLALYTGMRNGELYALTWDKVDLDLRQILINRAWNSKDGFKETKSGYDRITEIAPSLLSLMKELRMETLTTGFVLPRSNLWDKGEQARELRKFLMLIGLPPVRFHDLRATWATFMLSNGIAPIKVMIAGGWKDLKTMQIYVRKAGVDIKGISDDLYLHDPVIKEGKILNFGEVRSEP